MKDCFAYKVSGYCGALTEMVCKGRKCSFYKTKEQFKADEEKAKLIVERKNKHE